MQTSGIAEIQAELAALDKALADEALRISVRKGGRIIQREMSARAPILDKKTAKSTALDPGAMKHGMTVSVRKLKDGGFMAVIGPGSYTYQVAHLVEYGHLLVKGARLWVSHRMTGSGKVVGMVKPHPWLRPSFETTWRQALQEVTDSLRQQLGKWVH